jgi:S1/P1 Nuclease
MIAGILARMKLVSFAILLLLPYVALAWDVDGHQIVAIIAEEHLAPATKDAIHVLLGKDVRISDVGICDWADKVRREREETIPWHYVEIPTTQAAYDVFRDKQRITIISATGFLQDVLADASKPKAEREEALKFVVNLIGDLHQPLHCAERAGDHGGTGRLVFLLDQPQPTNLHWVWDSAILFRHRGQVPVADYALKLNANITPEQEKEWIKWTLIDWVNESHDIAVNVAYKDIPADGDPPRINQAYIDQAAPIIDEQLQRAGVRLAVVLNRAFAPNGAPSKG